MLYDGLVPNSGRVASTVEPPSGLVVSDIRDPSPKRLRDFLALGRTAGVWGPRQFLHTRLSRSPFSRRRYANRKGGLAAPTRARRAGRPATPCGPSLGSGLKSK